MKSNKSIPRATVIPVLFYPDVRQAVQWLCNVFSFNERLQIGENHRSQLRVGDGAVIIAEARDDLKWPEKGSISDQVMVRIIDVNGHCERSREQGARILKDPTNFPYGERQYIAEDLAGHVWVFTETISDINPEVWGGILKS